MEIISRKIEEFFISENTKKSNIQEKSTFSIFKDFSPVVSVKECFSSLLVTDNDEAVSPKNTYYINKNNVLRTHMTTHDISLLNKNHKAFISIGDVYRRDTIDATHYPVFHQVDGVRVYNTTDKTVVFNELKYCLEELVKYVVGDVEMRWVDAYFPFTEPSAELEIFYNKEWMEILGCGVLRDKVLQNSVLNPQEVSAWAFGIGLERLAMILFNIKDIRLFWSEDPRFHSQFKKGEIVSFKPFSKFPACYKDFAFFINDTFNETDFHQLVRDIAGDIAEEVRCIDSFVNKQNRVSKCFRVNFRHMEKSFTNKEINDLQFKIREELTKTLKVELR